jgi:hypothetical protein
MGWDGGAIVKQRSATSLKRLISCERGGSNGVAGRHGGGGGGGGVGGGGGGVGNGNASIKSNLSGFGSIDESFKRRSPTGSGGSMVSNNSLKGFVEGTADDGGGGAGVGCGGGGSSKSNVSGTLLFLPGKTTIATTIATSTGTPTALAPAPTVVAVATDTIGDVFSGFGEFMPPIPQTDTLRSFFSASLQICRCYGG